MVTWEMICGFRMRFGRGARLLSRWPIGIWDGREDTCKRGNLVITCDRRVNGRAKKGKLPAEEIAGTILSTNVRDSNCPVTPRILIPTRT
jgi:hypothetical protein